MQSFRTMSNGVKSNPVTTAVRDGALSLGFEDPSTERTAAELGPRGAAPVISTEDFCGNRPGNAADWSSNDTQSPRQPTQAYSGQRGHGGRSGHEALDVVQVEVLLALWTGNLGHGGGRSSFYAAREQRLTNAHRTSM